ncbi:hypothetical protein [Pseudalkalibacillus hwajinpoensis]|uniref:Uncharacterized protein n=1 Tax=Guptibacillus hwajinpoensis TaxID=208199 RepID=A0A4U1MKZ8_9BACL|nr:hypothetical protein [Pseudalkalibacillus hwajinpoensis]TKD71853.1 hypothetical protein FBF83_03370 [Pseudalkalibacillus hwajinpoensis]
MSEKKRKPKVIHVDKVIIKANEVIIQNDNDDHRGRDERGQRQDPWWYFGVNDVDSEDDHHKEYKDEVEADREDKEDKDGFSWF